jgi:poly-gamma-glutamate synthesis protein (capsule biosynthesis protein)
MTAARMVPEVDLLKVAAVGDIFPGDHYFSLGHGLMSRTERGALDDLFAEIAPLLSGMHIAICNLEGPLSRHSNQSSRVQAAAFRGLPQYCRLLREAGFTHVNLANNHILQHGRTAFDDTVRILEEHGLHAVGLRATEPGRISRPVSARIAGRNVCVVGYSGVRDRYVTADLGYAHFADPADVIAEIGHLSREFDTVIVSCHAGDEGLPYPAPGQIDLYRRFVEAGASCVLGHHSHVFQPVERYGRGAIAYSLGNFVFDLFWDPNTTLSGILLLEIGPADIQWKLQATEFTTGYRVTRAAAERSALLAATLQDALQRMPQLSEAQYRAALDAHESLNQRTKYQYFVRNLLRGNTTRKLHFLAEKFLPRL